LAIKRYGLCSHKVIFEGSEIIRRLQFKDNKLAVAMIDGKVLVVDMLTSAVLHRYFSHKCEVTSLAFDGTHLCSGGADGTLVIYNPIEAATSTIATPLSGSSPGTAGGASEGLGTAKFSLQLHARSVSGTLTIHQMVHMLGMWIRHLHVISYAYVYGFCRIEIGDRAWTDQDDRSQDYYGLLRHGRKAHRHRC
jgi:WD40 repeat protein